MTARKKMMDTLARRDHSEKELRQKLQRFELSAEDIETALAFCKEKGWIPDTPEDVQDLTEKTAASLERKGKGILYINEKLREKGLPQKKSVEEDELEKSFHLVKTKYSKLQSYFADMSPDEREKSEAKIARFLASRGYEMDIIRKVLKGFL